MGVGHPKSGPDFQCREHPDHPLLSTNKGPDLVGLKFTDHKAFQHLSVETLCVCGGRFKPAGDGTPGHAFDSSHGRYRNAVDTHVDDFIEQRSGLVQPIIRRSVGRREGSAALFATVAPPSSLCRSVEGMADDVAFSRLSPEAAIGVRTGASGLLAPFHTCLLPENYQEIQLESCVARLLDSWRKSTTLP